MPTYLATLGLDPAPVALGFRFAQDLAGTREGWKVVLVPDPPDGSLRDRFEQRKARLEKFLMANATLETPIQVEIRENESPFQAFRRDILAELDKCQDVYVNVTGGRKLASLGAWAAARGCESVKSLFLVNAHDPQGLSAFVLSGESRRHSATGWALDFEAYLRLYLDFDDPSNNPFGTALLASEDPVGAALKERFGASTWCWLEVAQPTARDIEDFNRAQQSKLTGSGVLKPSPVARYFVFGHPDHPHRVFCTFSDSAPHPQRRFMEMSAHTRELLGEFASCVIHSPNFLLEPQHMDHLQRAATLGAWYFDMDHGLRRPALSAARKGVKRSPASGRQADSTRSARTLLTLVGDQPIPTLCSYFASHTGFTRVVLLTSPQKEHVVRRIEACLNKQIDPPDVSCELVESNDFNRLKASVASVLGASEVTLNLNGGTTLMAIAALEALLESHPEDAWRRAEYAEGTTVTSLAGASNVVSGTPLDLWSFLSLHGLALISTVEPRGASEAQAFLDEYTSNRQVNFTSLVSWKAFKDHYRCLKDDKVKSLAGEVLAHQTLVKVLAALPQHPKVNSVVGAELVFMLWNGSEDVIDPDVPLQGRENETDVLALVGLSLVLVEVKASLQEALSVDKLEASKVLVLTELCGGRFAKGIVLGWQQSDLERVDMNRRLRIATDFGIPFARLLEQKATDRGPLQDLAANAFEKELARFGL